MINTILQNYVLTSKIITIKLQNTKIYEIHIILIRLNSYHIEYSMTLITDY